MHTTDYKNLNLHDMAAVAIIALGIFLVGIIAFNTLSFDQQKKVASAFNMFDLSRQYQEPLAAAEFIALEAPKDFLDAFYVAFTEVAATPETVERISLAYNNFLNYSDQVAFDYQIQNTGTPAVEIAFAPQVLGASTDTTRAELKMPYQYEQPKINFQSLWVDAGLVLQDK